MNHQTHAAEICADFYNKLVEEGPVTNIVDLVHNPLGSGYFFKFCKSKYCSETTSFVMEVDQFIEIFSSDDGGWEEEMSWKEIDKTLLSSPESADGNITSPQNVTDRIYSDGFLSTEIWPSGKVDRLLVIEKMRLIWSRFLCDGAADQVCLPAGVLQNTCRRMLNVHLYGSEVFQEACENPGIISTLRDIATRFQSSDDYAQCLRRFLELTKPASNVSIHVPGPRHTLTAMYTKNQLLQCEPAVLFSLDQFLSDNFLYGEFMTYLKRLAGSTNLRFLRAVHIFKKSFANTDLSTHKKAADWAFKMYLNFLRPGSAYEINVSEILRRDVARHLADPHIDLFLPLEKMIESVLEGLFATYTDTSEYATLRLKLVEKFDDFETQMKIKAAQSSMSYTTLNSKLSMARVLRENGNSNNNSHRDVRPTPPGSGRRNVNTFHHSVQSTLLQSGLSLGSTITAGLGGLVNSVVPANPRNRRPGSPRSMNTAGSNRTQNNASNTSNNSHGSNSNTARIVGDNTNTTSDAAEETFMLVENAMDSATQGVLPTTHMTNLTVVTFSNASLHHPADATTIDNTCTHHDNSTTNNNHYVPNDTTPCTLAATSHSTAATPMSTSSRVSQSRALLNPTPSFAQSPSYVHNEDQLPPIRSALNSTSGETSVRNALPSIPVGGEEEGEGDHNAKKIQKTNNGVFGSGYLPVLNFLGCMPTA